MGLLGSFFGSVIALSAGGEAGCKPGAVESLRSATLAHGAVVRNHATAFGRRGGPVLHRFGPTNANGHATVFGVLSVVRDRDCSPRWYRVQLPMKPNGATGWVRASEVELFRVRTRIVVDVSERRLVLQRDGRRILATRVAVGAPATPTPIGRFYVDQRLRTLDPDGPFGPGAVGFSAFSEVLIHWPQGGPAAIHGTNQPETIGLARSNGCLRVRNDVLPRIFAAALPGTPVVVRP